jgi:hypothetical protein
MMKVHLLDYFHSFLQQAPFYTATFLVVRELGEPVVVMRVEELSLFEREIPRARVGFQAWQSELGAWVVAVPFSLAVPSHLKVEGLLCLNPRREVDYATMWQFAKEGCVRFLFLSPDLEDATDMEIPWPSAQRAKVRQMIRAIDRSLTGEKLSSAFDPDFEQARQRFQSLYASLEVSAEVWAGEH